MIVVSNRVRIPDEHITSFLDRLRTDHGIEDAQGFRGMKVLAPIDAAGHVTVTFWDSLEAYETWRAGSAYEGAHTGKSAEDVFESGNEVEIHEVVIDRTPTG